MAPQANLVDERQTMYGNARLWTSLPADISDAFSISGSTRIPLGHDPTSHRAGLVYDLRGNLTPGHAMWFGSTRSGKGVSSIIPALLTAACSVVAIDPKGELAWITAERRRAMGQRVVVLDPWNEVNERYGAQVNVTETRTKFNPLYGLDPKSPNFNDDVTALADALVVIDPNDQNSHWTNSARSLIAGLIAAAVEDTPDGTASLRDVRELITSTDEDLVQHMQRVTAKNPNSLAARKLRRFTKTDKEGAPIVTNEISSIRSTAETQTDLLDSEMLLDAMETDATPFEISELVTGKVSLYLVLPPDRLSTHGRWLRMVLTMALRMIARQRKPPALPVLFILDEMGTIGPLRMIEDSYGLLAGLGVRLWGYLQDLSQLQRDYPRSWETFISNSSVIGLLKIGDGTTAKYFSDYLGTRTIVHFGPMGKHERQNPAWTGEVGTFDAFKPGERQKLVGPAITTWEPEESYHPRQVLLPDELRDTPEDELILIMPGRGNMRLKRYVYYSDPVLSPWHRPDPNKPKPQTVNTTSPPRSSPQAAAAPPPPPTMAPSIDLNDLGKKAGDVAGKLFGNLADRLKK